MCKLTEDDNKRTNERLEEALQFLMKEARSKKNRIPFEEYRLLEFHTLAAVSLKQPQKDIREMLLDIYKKGLQDGARRACAIVHTTYYEAQLRLRN